MENTNQSNIENQKEHSFLSHLICYLISYAGLLFFYIFFGVILLKIPSIAEMSEACQNTIISFVGYGFTAISVFIYLWFGGFRDVIMQYKKITKILYGVMYGIVLLVGTMFIGAICNYIAILLNIDLTISDNEAAIRESFKSLPVLMTVTSVVFAPFTEEVGYRLGIFGGIKQFNRPLAYIATAVIFGLIHFNFNSTNMGSELLNLPSYMFAGAWLCFVYDHEQSLAASTAAHLTNNLIVTIVQLAQYNG